MRAEIRLLGPFRVLDEDGSEVRPATRKAAALLAILAETPETDRSRDSLAALLWPSSGEEQARASLRQSLTHVRKALAKVGSAAIVARSDRIALVPGEVRIDATAFATAGDRADPEDLRVAVDAYAGPFLDGFGPLEDPFDVWVRERRRWFEERVLRALSTLVESSVGSRRTAEGLERVERALAIDPSRETFHRAAMILHRDAGQWAEALRAYERCRESLRRALDVAPSEETERIRREVARDAPSTGGAGGAPSTDGETPSIAVLPFENLSEDPEQGYFADGIAEDIITALSRFRTLAVTARNSSFAYRGQSRSIREIAADLGVTFVLEGSVRRAGGRLRVTAQLIDARDDAHVWADRYDVDVEEMFDVQDGITAAVVGALVASIDRADLDRARRSRPEDLGAYDLWLRGMARLRRGTPQDDDEARRLFERALERDPHFARGHAGISLAHFNEWSCQAWNEWESRERGAFESARKALELDDGDHLVHCILGRIHAYRREYALAFRHFERALALNANDADCLMHIALGHCLLGEHRVAVDLSDRALRLHPHHADWYYGVAALPRLLARRYRECVDLAERAPDAFVDARAVLAAAHARLGQADAARRHVDAFLETFRSKITAGRDPAPGEAVEWIFRVNPFRYDRDRRHYRESLSLAGLD